MCLVCVDGDQRRLEQAELLFLIVSVTFQTVSVLCSIGMQHQITCNLQFSIPFLVFLAVDFQNLLPRFIT